MCVLCVARFVVMGHVCVVCGTLCGHGACVCCVWHALWSWGMCVVCGTLCVCLVEAEQPSALSAPAAWLGLQDHASRVGARACAARCIMRAHW